MTLPLLASVAELAAFLRTDIPDDDPSAVLALQLASQIVRNEARQMLTLVTDETIKIEGGHPFLYLPERPVLSVKDIAGLFYATTADPFYYEIADAAALFGPLPPGIWVLDAQHRLRLPVGSIWPPVVQLTYTHGYGVIPDDIKAVVLAAAGRRWVNPTGFERESIGAYSYAFASGGGSGLVLGVDERRILSRYRVGTSG